MTAPTDVTPTHSAPSVRRRRWLALLIAMIGLGLAVSWATFLGQRGGATAVVTARPGSVAAQLVGPAIPAGQQRLVAGETAHLAGGLELSLFGPVVGVPPGSDVSLPANALVPIAFTIRVTAGAIPVTVSPSDFVVTMPHMAPESGTSFGAPTAAKTGITPSLTSSAFTVQPGQTVQRSLPTHSVALTGQIAYAPGGNTQVAWVFSTEDD